MRQVVVPIVIPNGLASGRVRVGSLLAGDAADIVGPAASPGTGIRAAAKAAITEEAENEKNRMVRMIV
jgi:hypothetical protein